MMCDHDKLARCIRLYVFADDGGARHDQYEEAERARLAAHIADCLTDGNPTFDRASFLASCGVKMVV